MALLRLFVYGTLKRGYGNHRRFCQGVLSVAPATTRGRLYELPFRYPMLMVPEEDILAHGSVDPAADLAVQEHFAAQMTTRSSDPGTDLWDIVHGELLSFDDPESRLPALDRLEGFQAAGPSLYYRVLIRASDGPAWTYIGLETPRGAHHLPGGIWPPGRSAGHKK